MGLHGRGGDMQCARPPGWTGPRRSSAAPPPHGRPARPGARHRCGGCHRADRFRSRFWRVHQARRGHRSPASRASPSSVPDSIRTLTRTPGACLRTFVSASWATLRSARPASASTVRTSPAHVQISALSGGQTAQKALDPTHPPRSPESASRAPSSPSRAIPRHAPARLRSWSRSASRSALGRIISRAASERTSCALRLWARRRGSLVLSARIRHAPPIRPPPCGPLAPGPATVECCRAPRHPAVRRSPPAPGPRWRRRAPSPCPCSPLRTHRGRQRRLCSLVLRRPHRHRRSHEHPPGRGIRPSGATERYCRPDRSQGGARVETATGACPPRGGQAPVGSCSPLRCRYANGPEWTRSW